MPHVSVCGDINFHQILVCEALVLTPDMLESQSRTLKTRMIDQFPLKTWVKKFAYWIGGQGRVKFVKKTQQHPPIVTSLPENPKHKTENLFQSALEVLLNPQVVRTPV